MSPREIMEAHAALHGPHPINPRRFALIIRYARYLESNAWDAVVTVIRESAVTSMPPAPPKG